MGNKMLTVTLARTGGHAECATHNRPAARTHLGTFTGQHYQPPEPAVSLPQAILAGLSLALFVVGGLLVMWGLS